MSVTRYAQSPALMQEMQQWLKEGFFDEDFASTREGSWLLRINICEYSDHFLVTADLPGVIKKDVEISLENRTLMIKGQRQYANHVEQKGEMLRTERYSGQFYRCLSLPQAVDEANIVAKLENGVLTLEIPKAKQQKSHLIEIQER